MKLLNAACPMNRDAGLRYTCSPAKPQAFIAEKKRLFSAAAQALVSYMLDGKADVRIDDIQLDIAAENCGAILIKERLSSNPEFQKMWAGTSCFSTLKTLARMALRK